jgi:hypothetical protein
MKLADNNTCDNIKLYLKDDGFNIFIISNVRESLFCSSTDESFYVYEFNLMIDGTTYSYRIQKTKIDNYGLKKSRKLKIEKLFKSDKEFSRLLK